MKRRPVQWVLVLWAVLVTGAAAGPAAGTLELSWCTVEASACCATTGSLRLHGVAGQPDVGELKAAPVTLAGGFLLPGDPVIKILSPATAAVWGIGESINVQTWADVSVTGNRIRLELWRNKVRVSNVVVNQPATGLQTYPFRVPTVTAGNGYSLRAVSERLESVGNPNPWVETGTIITIIKRTGVDGRGWGVYE